MLKIFLLFILFSSTPSLCMDNGTDSQNERRSCWSAFCGSDQTEAAKEAEKARTAIHKHDPRALAALDLAGLEVMRSRTPGDDNAVASLQQLLEEAVKIRKGTKKEAAWHPPCCNKGGFQLLYSALFFSIAIGCMAVFVYQMSTTDPSWQTVIAGLISSGTMAGRFAYSGYQAARNKPAEEKDTKALAVVGALAVMYLKKMGMLHTGDSRL